MRRLVSARRFDAKEISSITSMDTRWQTFMTVFDGHQRQYLELRELTPV